MIRLLLFLLLVAVAVIAAALIRNRVPLGAPPGPAERLKTYLTKNIAQTRPGHTFPELELPHYSQAPEVLYPRLEQAVNQLGWQIQRQDPERYALDAVVRTPLLGFKDDVSLQLMPAEGGSELHVRSASRVGKGDLGANTRHILDLLAALRPEG